MQEKLQIGNLEILSLMDMVPPSRSPEDFFPDVDIGLWEPYRSEVLDKGMVQLYYGCFVVKSKGKIVLVDTGIGPGPISTRGDKKGDLLNDLGIEYTKESQGAKYSRAKIPIDAHAAGVAVIDAIWQDLKDPKGLEKDCKIGKSLGYSGKSIIHPDQIPVVHKLFHPNKSEILWAKKVCKVYLESTKKGKGATTVDGKMIDEVHFKQAKVLLELVKQS